MHPVKQRYKGRLAFHAFHGLIRRHEGLRRQGTTRVHLFRFLSSAHEEEARPEFADKTRPTSHGRRPNSVLHAA